MKAMRAAGQATVLSPKFFKVLDSIAAIATTEVHGTGISTITGLCRTKTRMKPATKAGKREVFGKVTMVKARR